MEIVTAKVVATMNYNACLFWFGKNKQLVSGMETLLSC